MTGIATAPTPAEFDQWADDPDGPVALTLKQKLVPVEGEGGVIFPPTYADIGYNIDVLSDGTKVAAVDSVGSQANRMEPLFRKARDGQRENPLAKLVPQIEIEIGNERTVSILDLAHRAGDAVVRATPKLASKMDEAFGTLRRTGNAEPLAKLAPTSLVFGVWDSRGTQQKVPRIVRSSIRAFDVDVLHSAAQFNSVWKLLTEEQQTDIKEEEAKKKRYKRSEIGLADAPATFRKTDKVPQFRDGKVNPDARVLGGVIARGAILREITVNLVALRSIGASSEGRSSILRRYLLGLSLIAASADQTMYLREGCHLRYAEDEAWNVVPRRGSLQPVGLSTATSKDLIHEYAFDYHAKFKPDIPSEKFKFDVKEARKLLVKKDDEEQAGG